VTVAKELDGFIDATLERFGRLDGAVNNAGKSAAGSSLILMTTRGAVTTS